MRFFLRNLGDRDRQQLLLAQQLADLARAVAFEDALALAAAGIERGVFEGTPWRAKHYV